MFCFDPRFFINVMDWKAFAGGFHKFVVGERSEKPGGQIGERN